MAVRPMSASGRALRNPNNLSKARSADPIELAMASRGEAAPISEARLGTTNAIAPADFRKFYDENPVLFQGNTGSGQCIAVVGDSDYIDKAITAFNTQFVLPSSSITRVIVDSTNPSYNSDEDEALLDLEWAHAVAPGASLRYYLGNPKVGAVQALVDAVSRAVSDTGVNNCAVISISFAICGATQIFLLNTLDPLFAQAAAQGQTVVVAAGNQGAAGLVFDSFHNACATGSSRNVNEMSASSNVISVGGTAFNPQYDANGNVIGAVVERIWNDPNDGIAGGAGGGGASATFVKPAYQQAITPADGMRDTPDVALLASPKLSRNLVRQRRRLP